MDAAEITYLVSIVESFTFAQFIIDCFQHLNLLFFCYQVLFVSVHTHHTAIQKQVASFTWFIQEPIQSALCI